MTIYGGTPRHWTVTTIHHLEKDGKVELQTGPFGTMLHASSYVQRGVPVVAVKHIGENCILHDSDIPKIGPEDAQRLQRYALLEGDILFGRKGAVERRAYVRSDEVGWLQGSDCIRLRFQTIDVEPMFVSYLLGTKSYKKWIIANAQGTTMPSLNQDVIRRIPIALPPIPEQRKITSILKTLDDKIELNRRMNETLEQMAMTLYKHWFVDFGPFQNGEFVESELGLIPKGWEVRKLADLVKTQYGYTASSQTENVGPHFLRITDIQDKFVDWTTVPYCQISDKDVTKHRLSKGDIVVARTGNSTGATSIILDDSNSVFASFLIRLSCNTQVISPYYLFWVMTSDKYQDYITGASAGSTRNTASAGLITNVHILLPPMDVVEQFERQVVPWMTLINHCIQENSVLRETREYLLPRLVSGEIDLSEADKQVEEVM